MYASVRSRLDPTPPATQSDVAPHGLTDEAIIGALADPTSPASRELTDQVEPCLTLKIVEGQAHWWAVTTGASAAPIHIPIGSWPGMNTDQARTVSRSLQAALRVGSGDDAALTIAGLIDLYDKRRLRQYRKGKVIRRALDGALSSVRYREVASLTRRELSAIVDAMAERAPIHANRVLAYMKSCFNWAVGRGYLDANPAANISKPSRERTRERTPSLSEVVEIWEAAGALGYPFGPTIRLMILTAARRDEVGAMRRAEVSLPSQSAEGVWTLPADRSKNGRAIRAPLAPLARSIIEEALAARATKDPFVFTTRGDRSISGWSKAKARLDRIIADRRLGHDPSSEPMVPWRFHDLRRSFATHACDVLHIDPAVADRCLNHVGASTSSTVSRIYARNEMFDQRRDALIAWAELIECGLRSGRQADVARP